MRHSLGIAKVAVVVALLTGPWAVAPAAEAKDAAKAEQKKRQPPVKEKVQLKPEAAAEQAQPRVAHIRVGGMVLSSPPDFSWFAGQTPGMTLREWIQRLAKARNDDRIQAVALEVDGPLMNWAQAREFAGAVSRLNKVKPVYAHVVGGGATQYLVASAAKEVTMDPAGTLMMVGLGAELTFYKGTLDWIGIRPQMIQVGRFKGAAEPFTRTGPSNEFKGEYNKLLDDLYEQLCEQIARQRRLTVPHVQQAIDEGPHSADDAKRLRLVDGLVSKADWQEYVSKKVRGSKHKSVAWLADYARKSSKPVNFSNPLAVFSLMLGGSGEEKVQDPTIAIIHADGVIVSGKNGESLFGSRMVGARTMTKCFKEVAANDKIKAVIFRINSPGGSAIASEMIYQAVKQCAKKKPVIVSISGLGASGGYYIAMGGSKVLADEPAIVGSIGVVSGKLAMTELFGKLGISTYEITRGANAGLWMSRPWTEAEEATVRRLSVKTYDMFVSRVKSSRGKRIKNLDSVTQGRIFTARQAVKNGMVDQIGGMREAILAAQDAANIKRSYIITLPRPKTLMDVLYGGQSPSSPLGQAGLLGQLSQSGASLLPAGARHQAALGYLLSLGRILETETILTAMPYHVTVRP